MMMSHLTYLAVTSRPAAASDPRVLHAAELRASRQRRASLRSRALGQRRFRLAKLLFRLPLGG